MPGLLDLIGFSNGGGGSLTQPSPYAGLLSPQQQEAIRNDMLGTLGGNLAIAAAPSRLPVPFGAALGQAMNATRQQQAGEEDRLIKANLLGQQIQKDNLATAMQVAQFNRRQAILGGPQIPMPPGFAGITAGLPQSSTSVGLLGSGGGAPSAPSAGASPAIAGQPQQVEASAPQPTSAGLLGPTSQGGGVPTGIPGAGLRLPPGLSIQDIEMADALYPGAGKELMAKAYAGPSAAAQLTQEMNALPANSPMREIYQRMLLKLTGLEPQNVRQGGGVWDPLRGFVAQMPILGPGQTLGPGGSAQLVPNFLENQFAVESNRNRAAAQYRPLTGVTDQNGNPIVGNQAMVGGGGMPAAPRAQVAPPPSAAVAPPGVVTPRATSPVPSPAAVSPVSNFGPRPQVQAAPLAAAAAQPTETVRTPEGPKDISQVTLGDVMAGARVPTRPPAPAGMFYGDISEGAKETQKLDAQRLEKYANQAAEGQKIYLGVQQLLDVLQRGQSTSNIAPLFTQLANLAQGLEPMIPGISKMIPEQFDPNDAAVFDKVSTDMVFAALKQLPGQPRVAEIEGLQKANANRTLPRAANAEILHSVLANQMWMDKRAELASQFLTQHPTAPLATFDAQFNKKFPLTDVYADLTKTAREAGWRFPGDESPGASPKFERPGITVPQQRNAAPPPDQSQIAIGTTATGPNGAKVRWNGMTWAPVQ